LSSRSIRTLIAAGAALAALQTAPAHAAPRDLDPAFGNGGVVLTAMGTGYVGANAIAMQADGRIVSAGHGQAPNPDGRDDAAAVARHHDDGTLDTSFAGHGRLYDLFSPDGSDAGAVAIQPDGKILVAGSGSPCCFASIYVARYLPDGSRDGSFGDAGRVRIPGICCDGAHANGLAVAPDGKIVVAGTVYNTYPEDAFVARLTSSGDPDPSYGDGGLVRLKLGDAEYQVSNANALVLQGQKAVIAGRILLSAGRQLVMLARLDADGELDETFGTGGVVQDAVTSEGSSEASALASWNGKLVVAGTNWPVRNDPEGRFLIARYLADGELDESFRPNGPDPGHFVHTVGDGDRAEAHGVAVDSATGSITITGSALDQGETKLLVARYTAEGAVDPDWQSSNGNVGHTLIDVGGDAPGGEAVGQDVLLDPLGRTVIGGWALGTSGTREFLLARLGDTPPPPPPPEPPPPPRPPPPANAAPAARISGHRTVPRKTWVRFYARRSFDVDGEIVDYAWKVGRGSFHSTGSRPSRRIRFGRTGTRLVTLRVTDDDGATAFVTRRVRVVSRRG
jgi:uncharacterized delta-60 repeat protein